jgi:hypothetical protein
MLPTSRKKETLLLIGLLLLAFVLYISAFHFLRLGQGVGFESTDIGIFLVYLGAILVALIFLFLKSKFIKVSLFILGIILSFLMIFPMAFICFDQCPQDSRLIITLVLSSSFIYSSVFIWSMFQHTIRLVMLFSVGVVYFLSLVSSTPFGY